MCAANASRPRWSGWVWDWTWPMRMILRSSCSPPLQPVSIRPPDIAAAPISDRNVLLFMDRILPFRSVFLFSLQNNSNKSFIFAKQEFFAIGRTILSLLYPSTIFFSLRRKKLDNFLFFHGILSALGAAKKPPSTREAGQRTGKAEEVTPLLPPVQRPPDGIPRGSCR